MTRVSHVNLPHVSAPFDANADPCTPCLKDWHVERWNGAGADRALYQVSCESLLSRVYRTPGSTGNVWLTALYTVTRLPSPLPL